MPKLHLITYGCQMNEYDSERVAGLLKSGAVRALTDEPEDADLILLNTCAIREKAEDKVFSQLGALKRLKQRPARSRHRRDGLHGAAPARTHPGTGALRRPRVRLARHRPGRASSWRRVRRERAPGARDRRRRPRQDHRASPDAAEPAARPSSPSWRAARSTARSVSCRARAGRERSHAPDVIVEEIRGLAAAGLPRGDAARPDRQRLRARSRRRPTDLAALLERVDDVEGIERIRFTTSNPYNLTPRLIRAIRDVPEGVRIPPPAAAVGLGPRARADEPRLHARRAISS